MKRKEIKRELKRILDRLGDIQVDYKEYSEKADNLITKAVDNLRHALDVL